MTEETEVMLRLIRDGIVGYEWKVNSLGRMVTFRTKTLEPGAREYHYDDPEFVGKFIHDAINLSFKFGEKWIFEGDKVIVDIQHPTGAIYTIKGVIEYDGSFFIHDTKNRIVEFLNGFADMQAITVTGNIYETEANHE